MGGRNTTEAVTTAFMIEDYRLSRKVAGRKDLTPSDKPYQLDFNGKKLFGTDTLTQEVVDWWWTKRETEQVQTYAARVLGVVDFLQFVNGMGYADISIPPLPKVRMCAVPRHVPHYVTHEEMTNLMKAAYELPGDGAGAVLRNLALPVMLLLMKGCGLRPNEARLLSRDDVDFGTGEVCPRNTKGYTEHSVFPHDSLLEEMKRVDALVEALVPGRACMFPGLDGGPYRNDWLCDQFKKCWYKYNTEHCVAYDLRHSYVIGNIYSWPPDGNHYRYLCSLMKTLGHSSMQSTSHYFDLIPPELAERLRCPLSEGQATSPGALDIKDGSEEDCHGK